MSLSKYTKRRGQFEVLEAKQLFAADLMGGAATDLPDTPVVAGFDPGDLVAEFDPGDLYSVEMNPGDGLLATLPYVGLRQQADTALVSEIQSGKLTPTPNGSSFSGWSGEGCSGTGTCTITVDNKDYVNNIGTESPSEMVINDGLADSPRLGGQEGEPIMDPNDCPDFMLNGIARVENVSASPEAPDNLVPDTDCEFRMIGVAKGTQEE